LDWQRALRDAAPLLGLGMTLAVATLAGLGVGYWLDGRLGTRPAFLLVGGCVGFGIGMYYFIASVAGFLKNQAGRRQ
jgi:F0F1-type ATP synthase assembly protein I